MGMSSLLSYPAVRNVGKAEERTVGGCFEFTVFARKGEGAFKARAQRGACF